MNIKKSLFYVSFLTVAPFISGCVSSEILDTPASADQDSDLIIFSVSAPEAIKTRAEHRGYKLRYTAKLFHSSNKSGTDLKFMDKKEILDGAENNNEIIFKSNPDYKHYQILVFADYIPESAALNEEGSYGEYFYKLSNQDENIELIIPISENFINNDNYDCFSHKEYVYKEDTEKVEKSFTLNRAVARVRFVDTSSINLNSTENPTTVKISRIAYTECYQQLADSRGNFRNQPVNVTLSEFPNAEERELFYFYLFAGSQANISSDISFEVTTEGIEPTVSVKAESGTVPVRKNYITTVKGAFLPIPPTPNEPEQDGDIYIYPSANQSWEQQPISSTY